MHTQAQKIAVVVASGLCSAALFTWLHRLSRPRETLGVDNTEAVEALLRAHARPPKRDLAPEAEPWPPPLVREPLPREVAAKFYPAIDRPGYRFDPVRHVLREPNFRTRRPFDPHPDGGWLIQTNSLGLREDEDPPAEAADLCLLVLGDSQTEGVCANGESFPNRLEALLSSRRANESIDVWNCGIGGTGPFHYLATLEGLFGLAPDVVIAMFYGGNDFLNTVALERYFNHRDPPNKPDPFLDEVEDKDLFSEALGFAELGQLAFFRRNYKDQRIAVGACASVALELERQCSERGVRFLCAYLPPPLIAQPEVFAEERSRVLAYIEPRGMNLNLSQRLADEWIALLATNGLTVLDLRPYFLAAKQRLFWEDEWHLDLAGNEFVAAILADALEKKAF